jgi:SAM-dependent methyltransferase
VSSGQAAPRAAADEADSVDHVLRGHRPHARRFIARYMPADRRARIVDLGCGDGMLLHFLAAAGYDNAFGVDVSGEQVARARRWGLDEVQQDSIDGFLQRSGDGSADVVLLLDVLEHLTREDLFKTLDGVYRLLRAGGVCIAHLPNAEGVYGMRVRYSDLTHEQAFTAKSASQMFRAVGFADVRCHEDTPVVHGLTSAIRWLLWTCGTVPHRVLLAAETGETRFILSQNLFVRAGK